MLLSFTTLTVALIHHSEFDDLKTVEIISLISLALVYLLAYVGMVLTTVIVTKSDPTDPTVAFDRHIRSSSVPLDQKIIDIIQNKAEFYCNICQAHVIENSKHCQACNRCTYEFDHHCQWVSNDIGRTNYIPFMRMLLFVILTFLIQISHCVVCITIISRI